MTRTHAERIRLLRARWLWRAYHGNQRSVDMDLHDAAGGPRTMKVRAHRTAAVLEQRRR
jgi:hypothetical protein